MNLATRTFERTDWYITSDFGERINPVTHKKSFHYGCDYGTHKEKWKQYALENGTVVRVGYNKNGYGNYIEINYSRIKVNLFYGHLDKVYVKKGDVVTHDTCIGLTGTTGMSTGIHLHLGFKYNGGVYSDPNKYDYMPPSNLVDPTERKYFMNQIEVIKDKLRERKTPSLKGEILGYAKIGIYDYSETTESDGYTWYKIGAENWIAYVEGYTKVYPTGDQIRETEKLLNQALQILGDINGR